MAIRLSCPRCKTPLLVPNKLVDSYTHCAHCRGRLWVPKDAPADQQAVDRVEVEAKAAEAAPAPGKAAPGGHAAGAPGAVDKPAAASGAGAAPGTTRAAGRTKPASAGPGRDPAAPIAPAPPAPGTAAPGATRAAGPAPPAAPPVAATSGSGLGASAGPSAAASRAAPSGGKVARFVAPQSDAAAIRPGADGKLPELRLHEGQQREEPLQAESTTVHPLLLAAAICLSVVVSITLVLYDTGSPSISSQQKNHARQVIEDKYFSNYDPNAPLEPYQLLLREAQLAHIRGDYQSERELYRRVLDMLRAERPPGARGLTGSRSRDRELEEQIIILLSDR